MIYLLTLYRCVSSYNGHVRLSYEPYYFNKRTLFFSRNKSANNIFSHANKAIVTRPVTHALAGLESYEKYVLKVHV